MLRSPIGSRIAASVAAGVVWPTVVAIRNAVVIAIVITAAIVAMVVTIAAIVVAGFFVDAGGHEPCEGNECYSKFRHDFSWGNMARCHSERASLPMCCKSRTCKWARESVCSLVRDNLRLEVQCVGASLRLC